MTQTNQYEKAFAGWMMENRVQFVPIDQHKRAKFARNKVKSFDFIVYPKAPNRPSDASVSPRDIYNASPAIVEVKGKLFKGSSLLGLKGFQNWVTIEDIHGLTSWQDSFDGFDAFFVFVYRLQFPYADTGNYHTYEYDGERFFILTIALDDYKKNMTVRSKKWRTVSIGAADFRQHVVPADRIFCRTKEYERRYYPDCIVGS
jgi:hypothetical protein